MPLTPDQIQAINDGDTLRTTSGDKLRLKGFDAPETAHGDFNGLAEEPGAQESTALTAQYLQQPDVQITPDGTRDAYGRLRTDVTAPGRPSLAEEQLGRGLAFASGTSPETNAAFYRGVRERRDPTTPEQAALNERLDAQWAQAKPNYHRVRKQNKRGLGEVFDDAIDRGLDSMGLMAGGTQKLVGEMTGIDMLTEAGERRINENQIDIGANAPDVGKFSEVKNVGDAVTRVTEVLGEQGPNIVAMLGTALATGGAGALLEMGGAALAGETLAARAAMSGLQIAGKAMTREVGAVAAGATLNIGESKVNLDELDPNGDHNLLALGTGALKTGLDVFSLRQMPGIGKLIAPKAKAAGLTPKDAMKAWGDIPMGVVRASLTEGSTEGLQGLLDEAAANYKVGKPIDWSQVRESMYAGALVGGAMGGVGGVAEVGLNKATAPTEDTPDTGAIDPGQLQTPETPPPSAPAGLSPADRQRAVDGLRYAHELARTNAQQPGQDAPGGPPTPPVEAYDEVGALAPEAPVVDAAAAPAPAVVGPYRIPPAQRYRSRNGAPVDQRDIVAYDWTRSNVARPDAEGVLNVSTAITDGLVGTNDKKGAKSVQAIRNRLEEREIDLRNAEAGRLVTEGGNAREQNTPDAIRHDIAVLRDWLAQVDEHYGKTPHAVAPEPLAQVEAQVEAALRGDKPLVFVADNSPHPKKRPGLGRLRVKGGVVYGTGAQIDAYKAEVARRLQQSATPLQAQEQTLGAALGATRTKEEAVAAAEANGEPVVAAQNVDAQGTVITEVATPLSEVGEQQVPGGVNRVVPAEQAVAERAPVDDILAFQGPHRWLSNFWHAPVTLDGVEYPSVEHAYQASKTDRQHRGPFTQGTAAEAKRAGRRVPMRPGWEGQKVSIMRDLIAQKFAAGTDAAARLAATGDVDLVEGNTWGDTFWGVSNGRGENRLGKLLMAQRERLQDEAPAEAVAGRGGWRTTLKKVISGGQYGADLAALVAADALGFRTGGTAPLGWMADRDDRRAVNGNNPKLADFGLQQSKTRKYPPRTMKNVDDADVTVAFLWGSSAGTEKTIGYAQNKEWDYGRNETTLENTHRPVIVIKTKDRARAVAEIQKALDQLGGVETINIAGHRESTNPGMEEFVSDVLTQVLREAAPAEQTAEPSAPAKEAKPKPPKLVALEAEYSKPKPPTATAAEPLPPSPFDTPGVGGAAKDAIGRKREITAGNEGVNAAEAKLQDRPGAPARALPRGIDGPRDAQGKLTPEPSAPGEKTPRKTRGGRVRPLQQEAAKEPSQWANDREAGRPHNVDLLGVPKAKRRAKVLDANDQPVTSRLLRAARHGTKQREAPPIGKKGLARLSDRVRKLAWVQNHLFYDADPGSRITLFPGTESEAKATVADQHDLVVANITEALRTYLAEKLGISLNAKGYAEGEHGNSFASLLHKVADNAPSWLLEEMIATMAMDKNNVLHARIRAMGATADRGVGVGKKGTAPDADNDIQFEEYAGPDAALGDEQDSVVDDQGGMGVRWRESKRVTPEQNRWWTAMALELAQALGGNGIPARKREDVTVEELYETLRTTPIPKKGPKGGKRVKKGTWPASNAPADVAKWLTDTVCVKDGTPIEDVLFEGARRLRTAAVVEQNRNIEAAYLASVDTETGELDRAKGDEKRRRFESDDEFWARIKQEDPEAYEELQRMQRDIDDDGREADREAAERADREEREAALKTSTYKGDSVQERTDAAVAGADSRELVEARRNAARAESSRMSDQEVDSMEDSEALSLEELLAMDRGDEDVYAGPARSTADQHAYGNLDMGANGELSGVEAVDQMLSMDIFKGGRGRRALKRLRELLAKNNIRVVLVGDEELLQRAKALGFKGEHAPGGFYDPNDDIIYIGEAEFWPGEAIATTVLHELVHAATVDAYDHNPAFAKQINALFARARRAARGTPRANAYGMQNVHEFLAEAFSNDRFQAFLMDTRMSDTKSLWQRFVEAVRGMLGLPPRESDDAYRSILDALFDDALPHFDRPTRKGGGKGEGHAAPARETAKRALDELSRTAPAKAARLAAARNYKEAGQALWGGVKNFTNGTLNIMQPLLVANWDLSRVASREFANLFFRQAGTRNPLGLMNRSALREMGFRIAWHRTFKGHTPEAISEAWAASERARAGKLTREQLAAENPLAGKIQDFFATADAYVRGSGVRGYAAVEGIYLPQIHDVGAISHDFSGYVEFLTKGEFVYEDPATGEERVLTERDATAIARSITTPHEHAEHADLPYAGSLKHRIITDPRYQAEAREAGYLYSEPQKIVEYYIASLTKQVEFERRFGGYLLDLSAPNDTNEMLTLELPRAAKLKGADYRITAHLRKIYGGDIRSDGDYNRAFDMGLRNGMIEPRLQTDGTMKYAFYQRDLGLQIEMGVALMKYGDDKKAAREAKARMQLIISGYMGQLGADMNPTRRKAQQWVLMAQTVTTLAFSAISSVPELALIASMAPSRKALVDAVRKAATDRKGTGELLEDIGYGWDQAINVALLDNASYSMMDGLPRKIIGKFFVLNGQHAWTHMTRAISAQMALSHFTRLAEANDTATLQLHGLTPASVRDWMERRVTHGRASGLAQGDLHPMVEALHAFVDDRVIMPDAASRPTFMNDPRWALVSQLKGFFYAYGSKVMGGMWRRQSAAYRAAVARGDKPAAALVQAATPYLVLGLLGIGLAALAGELREKIKYDMWGEESPAWQEKHGMAYWLDLSRKSGMFGPMDMAINLFDENSTGVMGLLGPAAGHLEVGLQNGFFSEQFARRSTPVLGQLPGARALLADLVGYEDEVQ